MMTFNQIDKQTKGWVGANPDATLYDAYRQGLVDGLRHNEEDAKVVVLPPQDFGEPSFSDFWNFYSYKLSRKPCEKKWNTLTKDEKVAVMDNLPKYFRYLEITGYPKKHPLTYLNQACWEDEYPTDEIERKQYAKPNDTIQQRQYAFAEQTVNGLAGLAGEIERDLHNPSR